MALSGLAALKAKRQADLERAEARNRPKAEWLTSVFTKPVNKGGVGDEVELVFLQELDDSAKGYDEKRGLAKVEIEHQGLGKEGFKKRASCTLETEGQCLPEERMRADWENNKEMRQRTNLYINVAVNIDGQWKPFVLTRNFNSSFVDDLMDEAEDNGTITDAVYSVKKRGSDTTTTWKLKRLNSEVPDVSDLEVFDIEETVLRHIPYAKQAEWYLGGGTSEAASDEDGKPSGAPATADDEW